MRDSQRSKVYASENVSMRKSANDISLQDCQKLVNKLQKKYVKKNNGKIIVECRRDGKTASYNYAWNSISLPAWARNEYVVLHEFAHYLTNMISRKQYRTDIELSFNLPKDIYEISKNDNNYFAGHGPVFVFVLMMLVRKELGSMQYDKLKNSFYEKKVRTINSKGKVVKVRGCKD